MPIFGSEPVKSEFFIVVLFNLLPPVENQAAVFALVESACSGCVDGLASRRPAVMKFFCALEKSGRQAMHSGNLKHHMSPFPCGNDCF
jgi:hypothetical protein